MERATAGLEKLIAGSIRLADSAESAVLAWPLVCGSVVAERAHAIELAGRILRVEVPDTGWRNELQHLAPRYLAALNRYTGNQVERIEFVIRKS
ncbi:MAG TPA: DciA family protein [Candidatus Binatia bacterium]|nr:DciA family protein [Candidatus Binatia bacterium]